MNSTSGPSNEKTAAMHSWLKSITDEMKVISFAQGESLDVNDLHKDVTFAVSVNQAWDTRMLPALLQRLKSILPELQPTFTLGYSQSAFHERTSDLHHTPQQGLLFPVVTVEVAASRQSPEETLMRCT
jgi:hypothetical protein